jgi:hypothetical protein
MDVYEAISVERFALGAWGEDRACGGGGMQAMSLVPHPDADPDLRWCHGCGDWVPQLYGDDLCLLCSEIDARLDAHVGAALEDYADQAIRVALDYLHPDDVQVVIQRILADRRGGPDAIPRLRDRFKLSHEFIDERSRRARERQAEREARAREARAADAAEEPDGPRQDE